jgi:hypothetical protein
LRWREGERLADPRSSERRSEKEDALNTNSEELSYAHEMRLARRKGVKNGGVVATRGTLRTFSTHHRSSFVVKTMEEVPLERWLTEAPESALRTIASSVKRLSEQENMYRICLLDASLATLKLRPQFDMRVYSTEQGELALEGRELRLQSSDGIPGFVAAIDAFTNCDALLSPQPSSRFPGEEELVTDLRLQLSIDFPGFLATAPGFNVGGDEALSQLVSSLEKGAKQRAQSAYDSFAQNSTSAPR